MSDQGPVDLPVEPLIEALRAHAATLAATNDPTEVMPAINELRARALAYVNAVFEQTGWGNVFAELHEDEDEDEDWDDEEDEFKVEDGVERLTLTGRWDFLVRDEAALRGLAAERLRADSPEIEDDHLAEHTESAGAALQSLVAMDGPGDYPGLEDAGGGWSIEPVEKTLFEMTPEERDEAGF